MKTNKKRHAIPGNHSGQKGNRKTNKTTDLISSIKQESGRDPEREMTRNSHDFNGEFGNSDYNWDY